MENKLTEAKKNLEKVQKNAPKMGTSISEYKAAKAEHDALVAEAQKAVDYWNDVKAVHAKRAFEAEKPKEEKSHNENKTDNQGNPINDDGTLKVEEVKSVDELTDEDFSAPTRNVHLPTLPQNVDAAIGADGKPVVIKKNIFEKNKNHHPELTSEECHKILQEALYSPNLVGQTQPLRRPSYKVAVRTGDKNSIVVIDVYEGKNQIEIVGWRKIDEKGLEKMKRQAEREGGQFLILSPNEGSAAALSALPNDLSSESKVTEHSETSQGNEKKKSEGNKNAEVTATESEAEKKQTESGRLPGRSSGNRKYAEGSGNDEKSVRMRKATERVAEMLGTKIVWDDTIEKSNGYYDPKTNTIHVAKDAGNPLEAVFGHESLHRVRSLSEDAYNSLLNAVKKFVGEDAFKEAAQKKYDFYNSHGVKTSMDGAAEEVVGDEVGRMLDDKDYAEKLAYNLKHPVLSAIKDFLTQIKDAIVKAFGGGSEEARKVNDLLRTINKTYRKAVKEVDRKPLKAGEKYSLREEDENEKVLRDVVIDHLNEKNGIQTSIDHEAGQRVLDMANGRGAKMSAKQKRALETATIADESTNNATVVSSADGAKVQNNLETLAESYNNRPNKTKGFITDLSRGLGLEQHEASQYGTFETQNGKSVTIRVSNHNARVSFFDKNGEEEGISIVISSHKNKGVLNDGDAHIVEYFYPKQSLERAGGKPLSDIVRSVSEALNSGEFNDTTGLAQRQEVNGNRIPKNARFFKTKNGEAYGFTVGGRIYIDPRIANAETPIHEYAHLWSSALKRNNPKEWQNVVGLMKGTSVWDEVKRIYPELKTDDEIADETLSKFSGRQGAERLREEARKIASGDGTVMDKAKAVSALQKVKEAIDKFWKTVADFLHIHYTSAEQVADQVMKDLIEGVDPRKASVEEQQAEADGVKYSLVEDKNDLDRLEHEKTVKAYRAMVMIDGKLYPPMSSKDADGKLRNAVTLGKWEQADEAPDKAVERNGKWVFPLKKDNGKMLYAAYNPYIHSSRTMLNDQFSEAHNRDNLVVVEVEVPESELTSGYRAEKAKDGVGVMDWKAGIVQGQLTGKREVILSRWDKPVRVVPTEEVAESIADMLKDKDVVMPSNVVTKDQRAALEKLGVPFVETTSKGVIVDGEHAGETYSSVYGKKAKKNGGGKKYSLREDETRKGSEDDVEEVNSKFNERLDDLVSNPNQKDKILHLGRSSKFLKDGGVADAEIILEFDKFVRKSSDNYENNHPFSAEDIHDLPKAIHNPIALFDNTNGKGGFVILTELEKDGRNFIVALRATEQNRKGGSLLTVNEITTLYPKEARGIINWMNQGRIANADKEKALHFIEALQPHAGTTITSEELSSAANVVENFENPNLSDENNTDGKKFSLREGDEEQASGGVAKKDRVKQIVEDTMERLAKLNEEKNEKRDDAKAEAAKAVGGTLRAINKAMSAQREYDLHTVDSITKLAKDMLKHGLLHGLSDYEASRLFSAATNVHGKKDIKPYVQKVMDIMVNNQLGNLKDGLSKLLAMRGKKVNASGVEVQGGLDLNGQRLADTVWHGLGMTEEDIQTQMADAQDRMGDENRVIAHNAEVEYQAYRILQN